MNILQKAHSIIWLILLLPVTDLFSQPQPATVDSAFENYIREAWRAVRNSSHSDSLQNQYARQFYDYYKENTPSETADEAIKSAFTMWGNTGNDRHVHEALELISYESAVWERVLPSLSNIYGRNEDLDYQKYLELLFDLEDRISHPKSKAALYVRLIRYHQRDKPDISAGYAQKLVNLNASDWYTDFGHGYLYEYEFLQIGHKAPSFTTETVDGKSISLSDLKGNFVILEFWGTWCGPCMPEIPHLKTLWEQHGNKRLAIVGIALDDSTATVKKFTREKEMSWPQILQSDKWGGEIVELFNVDGVPQMYLIDPEGRIIAKDLRGEEMVSEVNRFIREHEQ